MALRRSMIPLFLMIAGCATIAPYSQTAYEQATSLKAEALILMDKATEQFSLHKDEVQKVRLDMDKAYEYAKGRPNNELSTKQWEIVRDPERLSYVTQTTLSVDDCARIMVGEARAFEGRALRRVVFAVYGADAEATFRSAL